MIYFDNAATTLHKPPEVATAMTYALSAFGNPGRGVHHAMLRASRTVFQTREALCELFGAASPRQIAFTANATQSLNTAIKGQ